MEHEMDIGSMQECPYTSMGLLKLFRRVLAYFIRGRQSWCGEGLWGL